ncbi:MAG: GAF domain-containing sensor histidine kinase [Chloroflexi bacterium]|nr:GAF domain-containing sensor histidine kinase [Chloroflexota bacterium]
MIVVNKRLLRWLTIVLPVGFTILLLVLTDLLFATPASVSELAFALLLVALGTSGFSAWVFRIIDVREAEIARRASQLEALSSAALALTTELDLALVLQKVVDLSKDLVAARFGALGVLDETGKYFEQFITSGISSERRREIGEPPMGHGVFSVLIDDGRPLRVDDIRRHHRSVGFPASHPEMKSLLGVPIISKGKVIGDLYVADKLPNVAAETSSAVSEHPFESEDQQVLEMFATQAAIAIENAKLYRQVQQLAVLEERQRFGMDLHDGIIQSIYAVGLMLEDIQRRVENEPKASGARIGKAIQSLNQVIRDLRNYILDLRPQHFQGRDILQGVEELARALRANSLVDVSVTQGSINLERITPAQTVEILHIAQEALSNVQKHARATEVSIRLENLDNRVLQMCIEDNGTSIPREALTDSPGNGLRNMRERTNGLGGEIEIGPLTEGGTRVAVRIPLREG